MSVVHICPRGHRWEAAPDEATLTSGEPIPCPICAATAEGETLPRAAPPAAGHRANVPGYDILEELGRGGMGVVYKARQVALNRLVALKMVLAGSHAGAQDLARFRAEAEAVARLQHPNIVQIYEIGEHEGAPYFSLEFVEGGSLAVWLDGTPQPPRDAAGLVETLARATHAAHQRGIVHRDLKPANVLMLSGRSQSAASNGLLCQRPLNECVPKIADFGLAKYLDREASQTQSGAIVGTPSYMAPEQAGSKGRTIGPATDVYSLGAILYELLSGRPPFKAATAFDTILQVVSDDPVPPSRLQSKTPRDLETICLKCLQKDPARRYATAQDLADDLHRFLASEPIGARPVSPIERAVKWARRRPAFAALLGSTVVLTALGFGLVLWQWVRAEANATAEARARQDADDQRSRAEDARRESQRLSASIALDRGLGLCEQDDVGRGMVWLARALQEAPEDAADLRRAIRANLAAWQRHLHPLQLSLELPTGVPIDADNNFLPVAFSPDGKTLVAAAPDRTAQVWDLANGRPVGPPLAHPAQVTAVEFSPDGKRILTQCADRRARLWEADGRPIGEPLAQPEPIAALVASPDGKTLVTVGATGEARLWDIASRQPIGEPFEADPNAAASLLFSPDSTKLLQLNRDSEREQETVATTIRVHDTATGRSVGESVRLAGTLVLPSADGKVLVAFAVGGNPVRLVDVQRLDPATGRRLGSPVPHTGPGTVCGIPYIGSDGRVVLLLREQGQCRLWDAMADKPVGKPVSVVSPVFDRALELLSSDPAGGQPLSVAGTTFSPNGRTFSAQQFSYGKWRLWDVTTGELVGKPFSADQRGPLPAPDGKTVFLWNEGNSRLWDAAADKPIGKPFDCRNVWDSSPVFSPDGRTVLVPEKGRTVLRNLGTGDPIGDPLPPLSLPPLSYRIGAVEGEGSFRRDGKVLFAAGKMWDATTGKPLSSLPLTAARMVARFSPDGKTVLTQSTRAIVGRRYAPSLRGSHEAWLWDAATGKMLNMFHYGPGIPAMPVPNATVAASDEPRLRYSPDGKLLYSAGRVWEAASGKEVLGWSLPPSVNRRLFFSSDGRTALVCDDSPIMPSQTQLMDVSTRKGLGPPLVRGPVTAAAFSPDGKRVAIGTADRKALLWDVSAGKSLRELNLSAEASQVDFSPGGETIMTVAADGAISLWQAADGKYITGMTVQPGVPHARFSPDGQTVLVERSGQGRERALLMSVRPGMPIPPELAHRGPVVASAFGREGKMLATGSEDNTARLWNTADATPIGEPLRHQGRVVHVAFSPDPARPAVLTIALDGTARLWQVGPGKQTGTPVEMEWGAETVAQGPDGKNWLAIDAKRDAHILDATGQSHSLASGVRAVAFAPDGRTVLTGSQDGTARLWEAATGRPLREAMRHERMVLAIAFSPDQQRVLTGSEDGTARLWDAATGRPLTAPLPHRGAVHAVAFSPDGATVLTGSEDRMARLWDAATGKLVRELAHEEMVIAVAFRPDGKRVLTCSGGPVSGTPGEARLWDAATGRLITRLPHRETVGAIAFSPDGSFAVTGSEDRTARLWDGQSGKLLGELRHDGAVVAVAIGPDSKRLLTGCENGQARLWDVSRAAGEGPAIINPVGEPLVHKAPVVAAVFAPDGGSVLTGSEDGTARVWDASTGKPRTESLRHAGTVYAVAFSHNSKQVATGSADRTTRIWDATTGTQVGETLSHPAAVSAAAFSADGRIVLTACLDGTTRRWDVTSGAQLEEVQRHQGAIEVVAFSLDSKRVLTGSSDTTARLWDVDSGRPIGPPLRHSGRVRAVAFSPDGKTALTASEDGTARLWQADTGNDLGRTLKHPDAVQSAVFSPDGRIVLTKCADRSARLWDATTGESLGEPMSHRGGIFSAVFSPDGRTVLTASEDGTARLWRADSGAPLGEPLRHQGPVQSAAFSPDGKTILTGSGDKTARFWDTATRKPIGEALRHIGPVTQVGFGSDRKSAFTGDGTIRTWAVPVEMEGTVEEIVLHVRRLTGLDLDRDGSVVPLEAAAWQKLSPPPRLSFQRSKSMRKDHPMRRSGFTFCEFAVVAGLGVMVFGLLTPTVFKVRLEGTLTRCGNNLHQLSLATVNCIDSNQGKIPPVLGWYPNPTGFNSPGNGYGTAFFHILPYIEQDPLWKKARNADGHYDVGTEDVAATPLPLFLCDADPTAKNDAVYRGWLAPSNYAANFQVFGDPFNDSLQGKGVYPASITDGTALTILYTERYRLCNDDPCAWGYTGDSPWTPTFARYSSGKFQSRPRPGGCNSALAQGPHFGGIMVGMADGSTRFVSDHVSPATWWAACTPAGADTIDDDW